MANELAAAGLDSGVTVVAHIRRDVDEDIFNNSTDTFGDFADAVEVTGAYDVAMTEQGTSGYYVGDFPSEITTAGEYHILINVRSGSAGSYSYAYQTGGTLQWTGTSEEDDSEGVSWVTDDEYNAMFGIEDDALADKLALLIPLVSVGLNKYLNRTVKLGAYSEVYMGTGLDFLKLNQWPVASVTTVTFDFMSDVEDEVDGDDFYVNSVGTMRFRPDSDSRRLFSSQWIKVVYAAGHSSVPQDLKLACLLVLGQLVKLSDPDVLVVSKTVKDVTVKYGEVAAGNLEDPIFGMAKALLDQHKELVCI